MEPPEPWDRVANVDHEAAYSNCRERQEKKYHNYDYCDSCQSRFRCWTAGVSRAEVTAFGERDKKYMMTHIVVVQGAIAKAVERTIDKEILNIYGLR